MKRFLVITLAAVFCLSVAGTALAEPVPDVKANGSDGPVDITPADTVTCTISLDAADQAGTDADWWFVVNTPAGIYSRVGSRWVPGVAVSHQGPLQNLTDYFVFSTSGLPEGDYDCIFGVDLLMDGLPTVFPPGLLFYDVVDVNVWTTLP